MWYPCGEHKWPFINNLWRAYLWSRYRPDIIQFCESDLMRIVKEDEVNVRSIYTHKIVRIGQSLFIDEEDKEIKERTEELWIKIDKDVQQVGSSALSKNWIQKRKIFKRTTDSNTYPNKRGYILDEGLLRLEKDNIYQIAQWMRTMSQWGHEETRFWIGTLLSGIIGAIFGSVFL